MSNYVRANAKGGPYFFTVVSYRRKILCDIDIRNALRKGIRETQKIHPFVIDAWVLLPDHLHRIWNLPENDADFSTRWAMIKRIVSKECGSQYQQSEVMPESKMRRHESIIWQRRFWEHQIRDQSDYEMHMNYIHYNPVKHGYIGRVIDWPHFTGKYLTGEKAPDAGRFRESYNYRDRYWKHDYFEVLQQIARVANERSITPVEIAMSWLFNRSILPVACGEKDQCLRDQKPLTQ